MLTTPCYAERCADGSERLASRYSTRHSTAESSSRIVDVRPWSKGKVGHMLVSEIFGPDLLIVVAIPLVLFGLSIWAIVDVSSHSKPDFYEVGSSKVAWIIVIALFTFFYGFGSLIAIFYLIRVRPKVRMVEACRATHSMTSNSL